MKKKQTNRESLDLNSELVKNYLEEWKKSSAKVHLETLDQLFADLPSNTDKKAILKKIDKINRLYHARVYNSHKEIIAECISKMEFDSRLKSGDITLVKNLCSEVKKQSGRYYQSFFSKYCSFCNSDAFPIYDNLVLGVLKDFCENGFLCGFRPSALRDYEVYCKAIQTLRDSYPFLKSYPFRDMDHWLWPMGGEKQKEKQN